jgi:hypothetical protein
MAINVAANFALVVTVWWRFPDVILRQKTDVTHICEKQIRQFFMAILLRQFHDCKPEFSKLDISRSNLCY